MKKLFYLLFISLILLSCNLSKEVDINLPIYEPHSRRKLQASINEEQ